MRSEADLVATTPPSAATIRVAAIEDMDQTRFATYLGIGIVLLIGFFVLTSPAVRTGSDDAYWFAFQIEQGSIAESMSARELLFIPLMKVVFYATRALGLTDRAFDAVGVANAFLAGGVVLIQFLILNQRLRLNRTASLLGALLLVVTFGFWRFSAEVEVYPLGLLAATGLLYLALANPRRAAAWAGIGTLGAIAFMAHGLTAMVSVVAIPVFLVAKTQWRLLIAYVAVLVPLTLVGTFGAYQIAESGDLSYWEFYSSSSSSELGVSPNLVARGAIGAGQAVISSGFLFAYDAVEDVVSETAPERVIEDEIFLAKRVDRLGLLTMSTTFLVSLLLVIAAIAMAVPGVYQRRRSAAVLAVLAWLVAIVLFQVSRSSGSDGPEAWLFAMAPLTMLIALGLVATRSRSTLLGAPVLVILVAVLALHNALGMALLSDPAGDRSIAKGEWILANAGVGDVVLTADSSTFTRYLRYEAEADIVYLKEAAVKGEDVADLLARSTTPSARIFVTADVLLVPEGVRYRSERAYATLQELAAQLEPRVVLVAEDDFGGIYRLTGP